MLTPVVRLPSLAATGRLALTGDVLPNLAPLRWGFPLLCCTGWRIGSQNVHTTPISPGLPGGAKPLWPTARGRHEP